MAKYQDDSDRNSTNQIGGSNVINIIALGTRIEGKINVESDFRLDGEVVGDIVGKSKVVIGEKGYLKGTLVCCNAEVMGKIDGNVQVNNSLILRATAELKGDVRTKSLTIEPNAVFNGSCSMREGFDIDSNFQSES